MSPVSSTASGSADHDDAFETIPCGYVVADRDGRITRANRTFLAWTGHTADGLAGSRFAELLPVGGRIFYETHLAPSLLMQGSSSEVALELVTAQEGRIHVLVNATVARAPDGKVGAFHFAIFRAVERRTYERTLLEARDQAEATVRSERENSELREQFIAVLGHDLRNPLASIASGVQMLGKEPVSARGEKVLALMEGSVVRAAALIDNVLDFARGRLGGGITLTRTAEPLEPGLRQVVSELRAIAPAQVITAVYRIDEPVSCDHVRIGQLLSNLLGNALTHGAKDEPVSIEAFTANRQLTITVSNGGSPIPAEALERLFKPFYRGSDRVRQGLGLGLHIASEIARAHGGTLVAQSDSAATTFIFAMPLSGAADKVGPSGPN